MVGVDASDESAAAVRWAAHEATHRGARLVLVTVDHWAGDACSSQERVQGEVRLAELAVQARQAADDDLVVTAEVLEGLPAHALVRRAAAAQLLVVGAPKLGALGQASAGSVAAQCSAHAHCPVVVVPRGAAPYAG